MAAMFPFAMILEHYILGIVDDGNRRQCQANKLTIYTDEHKHSCRCRPILQTSEINMFLDIFGVKYLRKNCNEIIST